MDWMKRLNAVTTLSVILRSRPMLATPVFQRIMVFFGNPCPCSAVLGAVSCFPIWHSVLTHHCVYCLPILRLPHHIAPYSYILVAQFTEENQKVLQQAIDGLGYFISLYKADCPLDFLTDILNNLLTKAGADLLPSISDRIGGALEVVRENFSAKSQVLYLITNHSFRHFPFTSTITAFYNLTSRQFPSTAPAISNYSDTCTPCSRVSYILS